MALPLQQGDPVIARDWQHRGPAVAVPPTALFVGGFALALGTEQLLPLTFAPSPTAMFAGVLFIALGLGLFIAGLSTFAEARTGIMFDQPATRIVAVGPYRWSRNPQYVGFVCCYLGATALSMSVWPWLTLPLVIVAMNTWVIAREERYMASRFGEDYQAYCRQVPRWI